MELQTVQQTPILTKLAISAGIVIAGIIASTILHRIADTLFTPVKYKGTPKFMAKTSTIRSLIKNIVDSAIFTIVSIMILSEWGFNIVPLLTGAGIIGLAISFGSQTLIKDILSGFFIIFEDQYNVGDKVLIADKYEGVVEKITLRLTVLRDKKQNLVFIPNSSITSVTLFKS